MIRIHLLWEIYCKYCQNIVYFEVTSCDAKMIQKSSDVLKASSIHIMVVLVIIKSMVSAARHICFEVASYDAFSFSAGCA